MTISPDPLKEEIRGKEREREKEKNILALACVKRLAPSTPPPFFEFNGPLAFQQEYFSCSRK